MRQWIRFIVVGAVNTAFSYAVYAACIYAGTGYIAASAVSMVAGVLFSHQTTGTLVFGHAGRGTLLRYVMCYLLVYAFSVALLAGLDALRVDPYVAGLVIALPCALLSFTLMKLFVFRARGSG